MRFFMARRFALKNLRANRLLEIPFVLSSGIMGMLFFIMASLLGNHYVETRHRDLPLFIQVGTILLCIFTFIFIQYAVNFMLKKRNKEFALYGILGLEKKHIRKIIAIEFFCLFAFIFSVVFAFVLFVSCSQSVRIRALARSLLSQIPACFPERLL